MTDYCKDDGIDSVDVCMQHREVVRDYHLAGLGETVEQVLRCTVCGRMWREVYIFACRLDDETDEEV